MVLLVIYWNIRCTLSTLLKKQKLGFKNVSIKNFDAIGRIPSNSIGRVATWLAEEAGVNKTSRRMAFRKWCQEMARNTLVSSSVLTDVVLWRDSSSAGHLSEGN